jgi:hypothetical protein
MKKKSEDNISEYPFHMETKVALLEQSISHINQTLIRIEKRLDKVDDQLIQFRGDHMWIFCIVIAFGTGLMGLMAHGFHWI